MICGNPFPLNASDAQAFLDQSESVIFALPPWGGIVVWQGRLVLVYRKPDGNFMLSDISGGIPWSQAVGGCIPGEAIIRAFSNGRYISPTEAFFMSLPENFMAIAKERFDQMIAAGEYLVDASGKVIENVSEHILKPITSPLSTVLIPLAVIAGVVLVVMYVPRSRAS